MSSSLMQKPKYMILLRPCRAGDSWATPPAQGMSKTTSGGARCFQAVSNDAGGGNQVLQGIKPGSATFQANTLIHTYTNPAS